jgi:molybdate transport system permease protein
VQPLWLSLEVAGIATLLSATLGVALGALLASRRTPGRDLLDVLFTLPMVLPPTVLGYYLLVAVGRRSIVGSFYERLTGSTLVFTVAGAILAATVGSLPIVIKSARAAIESVDPIFADAAATLGAPPLKALLTVRLPLAGRGILAGVMLAFARALGDFGVTLMVAGDIPGQTRTASLAIYDLIQEGRDAEALSLILILSGVALVTLWLVNRLVRHP